MTEKLAVAVVGAGMAGRSHANGYRQANTIFGGDLPPIRLATVADVNLPLAEGVARQYGFEKAVASWQEVAEDPDIDVVSVVVGNSLHREIVEALLQAGKHVLCEKPLADSVESAQAMVEAAQRASTITATAYSFRRNPAIEAIRSHLADGSLGQPMMVEAHYLADYAADPKGPMGWRFEGPLGTGALADLGAHIIDLAEYVCGPIVEVSGARFGISIPERNVAMGAVVGHDHAELSDETRPVTNDDSAIFTASFASGAIASIRASRVAFGLPNDLVLTLTGTEARAEFDWKRPAEFVISDSQPGADTQGDRTVYVGPGTSAVFGDSVPMPGGNISFGYGDLFVYQTRAFLDQVLGRESVVPPCATFEDGLHTMQVIEAVKRSHGENGAAVKVG